MIAVFIIQGYFLTLPNAKQGEATDRDSIIRSMYLAWRKNGNKGNYHSPLLYLPFLFYVRIAGSYIFCSRFSSRK